MGFTVQAPAPVQVLAAEGDPECRFRFKDTAGSHLCARPPEHDGGHLGRTGAYAPREES